MPRRSAPFSLLLAGVSMSLGCRRPAPAPPDSSAPSADAPTASRPQTFPSSSGSGLAPPARAICRLAAAVEPFRYSPSVTVLADGRVLIAGGRQNDAFGFLRDARIWDPATDTLISVGNLAEKRAMHAAVRIADGKVVVAGGTATAVEVFDPATRTFRTIGKMTTTVTHPTMVALPDGGALIAGGDRQYKGALSEDVYVVDPTGTRLKAGPPLPEPRAEDIAEIDGENVRLSGGATNETYSTEPPPPTALVAPWKTLTWKTEPPRSDLRSTAMAHPSRPKGEDPRVLGDLPNGGLLAMTNASLLRFDHGVGWSEAGGFRRERIAAEAARLPNGDVIVVGGLDETSSPIEICRFAPGDVPPRDFRADALQAAGLAPGDARDEVRPWAALEDGAVVLRAEGVSVDPQGGHLTMKLVAVERSGGALRAVASTTTTIDRDDCTQNAGPADAPAAVLDLARYQLTASAMAIGVRVTCGRTFPAGEGTATTLHLFRIDGATLVRVFDAVVKDYDVQRGPGDVTESSAIVVAKPSAGGAWAELVVRSSFKRARLFDETKAKRTGETVRYTFDGARYVQR